MSTALTATYKDVQVVREFVRQLYGFDKGKISDFIDKTRYQCVCLRIGLIGFQASIQHENEMVHAKNFTHPNQNLCLPKCLISTTIYPCIH